MSAILRLSALKRKVALSKVTIWRLCRRGAFPRPVRLSAGAVGWIESEVDDWIEARRRARDQTSAAAGERAPTLSRRANADTIKT